MRLIRQLNEANFKTEEIRNNAIDEFAERLKKNTSLAKKQIQTYMKKFAIGLTKSQSR